MGDRAGGWPPSKTQSPPRPFVPLPLVVGRGRDHPAKSLHRRHRANATDTRCLDRLRRLGSFYHYNAIQRRHGVSGMPISTSSPPASPAVPEWPSAGARLALPDPITFWCPCGGWAWYPGQVLSGKRTRYRSDSHEQRPGGHGQAGEAPHATARLRHASQRWLRHADDSSIARASGGQHDDDLCPRSQPGRQRGVQSPRSFLITARNLVVLGCIELGCRIVPPNTYRRVLPGEGQAF